MRIAGGPRPPDDACNEYRVPAGTHEVVRCNPFGTPDASFHETGSWRGFMRPYRDANPVFVACTGAIGPRLLPRGPPGPKAVPLTMAARPHVKIRRRYRQGHGDQRPASGLRRTTVTLADTLRIRHRTPAQQATRRYHHPTRARHVAE